MCCMEIEQNVFLSNASQVFVHNEDVLPDNGRFRLEASTYFTSVRRQTWPRLNFRETTYGVYQIFICIGVQYLINCMTCRALNTTLVGYVLIAMYYCFDSTTFWLLRLLHEQVYYHYIDVAIN